MTLLALPPLAVPLGEVLDSQDFLELDPVPRNASVARHFVGAHLPPLDDPGRDTLLLLTSEVVTNVVIHARTRMTLAVSVTSRYVVVAVHDLDLGHSEVQPEAREGGRGLVLVDALADGFGVHHEAEGGKTTWFRVARTPSEEGV